MSAAPHTPKNRYLIAVSVAAALVMMAWIVNLRLGDTPMPFREAVNMNAAFGTPADLSRRTFGSRSGEDQGSAGSLPVLAESMPEFIGIKSWLNSAPLTPADLKGKVVLIDFWTYSCINCIRTLPYVTSWHEKYKDKGFTVIGVHTPEFAFEKIENNVRDAIKRYAVTYPVPLDNDYGTWNSYGNRYWPAHYLFDAEGRLRYTHFGEGKYDETERNIRSLLEEAGTKTAMPVTDLPSSVDFGKVGTHETYLGYGREEYFGGPERVLRDLPRTYSAPAEPELNVFYLSGSWTIEAERAVLDGATGAIIYRYRASNANLVMGAAQGRIRAEVTLDGVPVPAGMRGADLVEKDGKTYVEVMDERLYDLIDARGDYGTRLLRIEFLDAGAQVYAFTFG